MCVFPLPVCPYLLKGTDEMVSTDGVAKKGAQKERPVNIKHGRLNDGGLREMIEGSGCTVS